MPRTIADSTTPIGREDDLRLVRLTLAGDDDATAEFVERMQCVPAIVATQNQRMGSPLGREDLADVVQDSLTKVWKKLGDYAGKAALETWVYRFCFLELMNGIRRKRRRRGTVPSERELEQLPAPRVPRASEFEHLHRGLDLVGPPEADVLRLKHFESLTFDEIGRRLGVSPNTAKTQYYRGLERLKERLDAESGRPAADREGRRR